MSNDLGVVIKAAQLLKEEKRIHFVLVGDGKEKPALIHEAEELDLPNITFMDPAQKTGWQNSCPRQMPVSRY